MMAAIILCLVVQVLDGTSFLCSDKTMIRIAGLETGRGVPKTARAVLTQLTLNKKLSCLPAGNEGDYIVAKCTLPDGRDLACAMIAARAAVRSDVSWRRYGLQDCRSTAPRSVARRPGTKKPPIDEDRRLSGG